MTQELEKSYKNNVNLNIFFNKNEVRIHNLYEYFKEKGIIAFSNTRAPIAKFASNFIYGIDSQEKLKNYIGIKAFPTISGILLKNEKNIPMEDLVEYFDLFTGIPFEDIKNSTLLPLKIDKDKLIGIVEYTTVDHTGNYLFEVITRHIEFEITAINGAFIVSMFLKKENDYNTIYGILKEITNKNPVFSLKPIEHNLDVFNTTNKKNVFFKEIIEEIYKKYQFLGIIKFTRTPAEDLNNATDAFEKLLREGTLETKLTNIEPLLSQLTNRNARLKGVGLVFKDKKLDYVYMIHLDSDEKKKRIEIGFISDVKSINDEEWETFTCKDDFDNLQSANYSPEQKTEFIKNIWILLSSKYYELLNRNSLLIQNNSCEDIQSDSCEDIQNPSIDTGMKLSKKSKGKSDISIADPSEI